MTTNSAKTFKPSKVTLTSVSGEEFVITDLIGIFSYFEDIFTPFVSANMSVIDSGMNLIGTLPIQGGEKVNVTFTNIQKEEVTYELLVWKVFNRQFDRKVQVYNLALLSPEAIANETARATDKLKGKTEAIVQYLLQNELKTKKQLFAESSKFSENMFPNGRKCHAIIQKLMVRCVPKTSKFESGGSPAAATQGSQNLGENAQKSKGTAGYLFFENKDGFFFQSIDKLCSDGTDSFDGKPPVATYESRPAVNNNAEQNFYTIEEYKFTDEIDIIDKLNNGVFSTHMCFFDLSAQKYEEYQYDMRETFKNMSHLGSQTKLPQAQAESAAKPSRIMSILLDHESWYSDEKVARLEEDGDAEFPDYAKYWVTQSIGRRYLMENQKIEISVPGNSELKAGDKIVILIPNMSAEALRVEQQYDEENSGTYLISQLSHNYICKKENGSPEFITRMALIRDTYGIKEYESNVK